MGFFDGIFKKIPFVSRFSKKKAPVNNVELQYNKAMNLMDNGDSEESVKILEQVSDIGIMDTQYKSYGDDALLALAEFYEKGVYRNAKTNVDMNKSTKYYEKYVNQNRDGDVIYKLAKMMLEIQNFSKAIKYFEIAATDYGIKAAYMSLGSIYESGLNRIDEYGNKSDFVVPADLEKAMQWYKKLADAGDAKAKASYERVLYASTHEDSLEFEEKDKLYTEISQRRKEKRDARISAGLCPICGKAAVKGQLCLECYMKHQRRHEKEKQQRALRGDPRRERIKNGLCWFCDSPALEGKKVCQKHYDDIQARFHNRGGDERPWAKDEAVRRAKLK